MLAERTSVRAVHVDHGSGGAALVGQADHHHSGGSRAPQRVRRAPTPAVRRAVTKRWNPWPATKSSRVGAVRRRRGRTDNSPRPGPQSAARKPAPRPGSRILAGIWPRARSEISRRSRSPAITGSRIRLHSAELDAAFDDRAHMRVTLLLVCVQQIRVSAVQDQIELERRVLGVTDSGAHALTKERRHLMSCVTGEHYAFDRTERATSDRKL